MNYKIILYDILQYKKNMTLLQIYKSIIKINNNFNLKIFDVFKIYILYNLILLLKNYKTGVREIYKFIFYGNIKKSIESLILNILIRTPYFKTKINNEINNTHSNMISESKKLELNIVRKSKLDNKSVSLDTLDSILKSMTECDKNNTSFDQNQLSGTIYNKPNISEFELYNIVLNNYYKTNPLHSDTYPSLITMEKDIISISKDLYNCPDSGCGLVTSGGTESIILALYTYREYSRKIKSIYFPEIVAPITVHPAFDKGCKYLNIKLNKIEIDKNNNLDLTMLKLNINKNTILIVGSAPSFSHGLMDDIETLSDIALQNNIPIHVDACLGGFILPFINYNFLYDFKLRGVTSLSTDTHKYGCCPKGSSILLFRNKELLEHCYFIQSDWCGGIYATSNITGSRSGLNLALTWSILNYIGKDGFKKNAITIHNHLNKIVDSFKNDSDIFVFGSPCISVVAFGSYNLNIYEISGNMKKRGWGLNELQNPPSFHFCITNVHTSVIINKFILDLKSSINSIIYDDDELNNSNKLSRIDNSIIIESDNLDNLDNKIDSIKMNISDKKNKNKNKNKNCSIYGTTQQISNKNLVDDMVVKYLNTLHTCY